MITMYRGGQNRVNSWGNEGGEGIGVRPSLLGMRSPGWGEDEN